MNFLDLEANNFALLAKQGWKLISSLDSLLAQSLPAKYYKAQNILEVTPYSSSLYVWKSLLAGIDLLKFGLRWCIGIDTTVRAWIDPWIYLSRTFG